MGTCTGCGHGLSINDRFCSKCGSPARDDSGYQRPPHTSAGVGADAHKPLNPPKGPEPSNRFVSDNDNDNPAGSAAPEGGYGSGPRDGMADASTLDERARQESRGRMSHEGSPTGGPGQTGGTGPARADSARNFAYMPAGDTPSVDRKTRFLDGTLVLTNEDVILYSGDERDEIKRIPLRSVASCSTGFVKRMAIRAIESGTRGRIRGALTIRKRENVEENFARHVRELEGKMSDEKANLNRARESARRQYGSGQGQKDPAQKIRARIDKISSEMERLRTDPDYILQTKHKKADIKSESFQLPQDFADPDREYKIWEHAINRRLEGIKQIRVATFPPDAVLVLDGYVYASTPCVIDRPLTDSSAISGKHRVQLSLEGYKPKSMSLNAKPKSDSQNIEVKLEPLSEPRDADDRAVRAWRELLPDYSVDMSAYEIEYEAEGRGHTLLLCRNELMVVSPDKKRCMLKVPYGAVTDVKLEKKFMGGIQGMTILYDEDAFSGVKQIFAIEESAYGGSRREVKHRYDTLYERLLAKKGGSYAHNPSPLRRSKEYYWITEKDIADRYRRFDPYDFERLVAKLFNYMNYETEVTSGSGDKGVDVIARTRTETIVIQVKQWDANVGGPDVHKTLGSMVSHRASRAMVVTTSDFTNQAYDIQRDGSPVDLWNGARLDAEIRKHMMGDR